MTEKKRFVILLILLLLSLGLLWYMSTAAGNILIG